MGAGVEAAIRNTSVTIVETLLSHAGLKNAQTFLRDGAYVTDPVLRDGQATYTPGISERRGSTTTFQHSGLKNAEAQSGVAQTLTATKQYDAFGNLAGPVRLRGGFGYQTESDSGLMLLGHRYLDPSTGRFLTRDPVKDGRNWYGYVGSYPTRFADPSGLTVFGVVGSVQVGGGLSGSLGVGVYFDTVSGHLGVGLSHGVGLGIGGYGGFGGGVKWDPFGDVYSGRRQSTAVGIAIPIGGYEANGLGSEYGHQITVGPGSVAMAYVEDRWDYMQDLGGVGELFILFLKIAPHLVAM